jgi:uncharacterized membrane protein
LNALRSLALLSATISMGVAAGAFALYAHTIMPGLATTDDRTFVAAFSAMDESIMNPWFMVGTFFGALLLTAFAGLTHRRRATARWIAIAFVLYLITVIITSVVHVPLNDAIAAAGLPSDAAQLATVRAQFGETGWRAWNQVRVVASMAAFGCLAWALVVHGRSSAGVAATPSGAGAGLHRGPA